MGENDKFAALLGSAYLLKKADDRIDSLERKVSEVNKDIKSLIRDNNNFQKKTDRLLDENKRLLKEIKQKIK
jgi:peptidoglycan hydrolase CwlO-like protein